MIRDPRPASRPSRRPARHPAARIASAALVLALGVLPLAAPAAQTARAEAAGAPPQGAAEPVPAQIPAPAPEPVEAGPPPTAARAVSQAAPPGHDLSPWTMFLNADLLVKAVMSGLALASVATWTILLAKSIELGLAGRRLGQSLARLASAATLAEAGAMLGTGWSARRGVADRLVAAAADEMRISDGVLGGGKDGVKERAASRCAELVKAEGRAARRGMGALATIGAISPFVGLFGTVWGIMNSFIGISRAQTTNLAVVAPGIAEALLATAVGLAAAIPAVIVYNHFARATRAYGDRVQRASGAAMRLLSRDLDRPPRDLDRGAAPAALPRAAE